MTKQQAVFFLLALFFASALWAQEEEEEQVFRERYFRSSVGLASSSYRDLGTSPLFYDGTGLELQLGHLWLDPKWIFNFSTKATASASESRLPERLFWAEPSQAVFLNFQAEGRYLRFLPFEALDVLRAKNYLGLTWAWDFNARLNPSLQNASAGLELFTNLMLSAEHRWDLSRKEAKPKKILFIKLKRPARKRELLFAWNVGLLNFNYRPGYAYLTDAEIDGPLGPNYAFAGHRWSLNGWRLRTHIEYIVYKQNGNAQSVAYTWEALQAPGKYHLYQQAFHSLRYCLYFQSAKKPKKKN